MRRQPIRIAAVALLAAWAVSGAGASTASSSASYRVERATLAAGAGSSQSASWVLTPTVGQELTIGTSASPGFVLQSGFWSVLGSSLVPVVLTVDRGTEVDDVDLAWSGTNDPYDVYASTDCMSVYSAAVATTSANALPALATATAGLTCINVQATAPGPSPPPMSP